MDKKLIWKILEIEETKDKDAIVAAYRTKVVTVNPEDDPEGFKQLREAYELAISLAENPEEDSEDTPPLDVEPGFEEFVNGIIEIYDDLEKRTDIECWKELFNNPICTDLDTADTARDEFLKVLLDRFYLPHDVFVLADETFIIKNEAAALKEKFQNTFIDYVCHHIEYEDFIDYKRIVPRDYIDNFLHEKSIIIPGIPEKKVEYKVTDYVCAIDSYLKEALGVLPCIEDIVTIINSRRTDSPIEEDINIFKDELYSKTRILMESDIWHPIEMSAQIRLLDFMGDFNSAKYLAQQIIEGKMEELADSYLKSNACYIIVKHIFEDGNETEYPYLNKVGEMISDVLSELPDFNLALRAEIFYLCIKKEYAEANEKLLRIFELDPNSSDANILLPYVNGKLVDHYKEKLSENPDDIKTGIDLAWGLFRCDRREETYKALKSLPEPEEDDESFSDYNNLLGRCYTRDDKYREAIPYLEKWNMALNRIEERKNMDPDSVTDSDLKKIKRHGYCYYLLGSAKYKTGEVEEGIKLIRKSIETEKEMSDIPYYKETLGMIYHEIKDYPNAMEIWNDLIAENKYTITFYIHRQETAFYMRDAQLVIDDYHLISQHAPLYVRGYYYPAKVFIIYEQYEDAKDVLKKASDAGVESNSLDLLRAEIYMAENRLKEAGEIYERLYSQTDDEDLFELKDCLRDLYLAYGHYLDVKDESTEQCYRQAVDKIPDDASLNYSLGACLYNKNKYQQAEEYLNKALKLNPKHRGVHNKLARLYADIYDDTEYPEKYEQAVEHACKQLENDDDDYYFVERALLYSSGYEFEKVVEDCNVALEKDPTNYYAYNARGYAYMMLKEYKNSEDSFLKGIEAMKDVPSENVLPNLYNNLARCYEMQGKYNEAISVFGEILDKFGENVAIRFRRALAFKKAKRFDEAVQEYEQVAFIYMSKLKETDNEWYHNNILEAYDNIYTVRLYQGNFAEAEKFLNKTIKHCIDSHRLLNLGGIGAMDLRNRNVAAYMLKRYAEIYLYNKREFKKAYKILERCLSYFGSYKSIKDYNTLSVYIDVCIELGEAAYRIGKKERAMGVARDAIECFVKISGSKENYLKYPKNSAYRKKGYAMILYFLGEKDEAIRLANETAEAMRCNFCRHPACYEAFLSAAKICEFENDIPGALEYYRKAADRGIDDSEVFMSLKFLTGGKN